jgi:membrane protein YdbS with pleckstrin-like domain
MQTQLPAQIKTVWRLRAMIDGLLWVILAVGLASWSKPYWLIHMPWWPIAFALGLGVSYMSAAT